MGPSSRLGIASAPLDPRSLKGLKTLLPYFLSILCVATAIMLTSLLDRIAPTRPNLFLFFVATGVSAWFAGPGPGWLSVILSTIAVDYFFIEPTFILDFNARDIPWLIAFATSSTVANVLSLQRRRAEAQLLQIRNELEVRVDARTRDLQDSNARLVTAINERVRAEKALRVSQTELARVARIMTVGEFTASIAHEINQPLGAIVANGEAALNWLRRDPPALPEIEHSVRAVITSGQRAADVIGKIRSMVVRSPPDLARVDINEIVNSVLELTHMGFRTGDVAIECRLGDDVPPVMADRVQLQHLLLNLLNNAVESMTDVSDRQHELLVRTERTPDHHVAIIIEDSGQGFADADAAKIFEPFYSTKQDGMGMGLSICQTIAQLHGGRIAATSRWPCGLIFRVDLPAEIAP